MISLYESILRSTGAGIAKIPIGDYPIGTILDKYYAYSITWHTFYKVVGHKGKSALIIRQLNKNVVSGNSVIGTVIPDENEFAKNSKEITVRISSGNIKLDKYSYVGKWDGKPKLENHMIN